MDTNLLTIDNMMFAATTLTAPPISKSVTVANKPQFFQAPDNTYLYSNTSESITTDKISTITQNDSISKTKKDFKQALRKTIETESSQQNQRNAKADKKYSTSELSSKAKPTQSLSTLETPITPGNLIKENAIKVESKTGSQLAQLTANPKNAKSNSVPDQASKSVETKLPVTIDKDQTGLKSVLPDTFSDQHKLQTSLSNISKGISITDTQPGNDKNNDKISVSNGNVVVTKSPTNIENTKELIPNTLLDTKDDKAATNEKASILGTSVVTGSINSSTPNGQKAGLDTIVNDGNKTTKEDNILTDKSVIDTDEKTPVLNTNVSQIQNKITGQDSQPISSVSENSAPNAQETTESKTTNSEIISESSISNNKDTQNTANKIADDSTARDLNITDVQISINQAKKHNSPNDNNPNSDSEQTPSHNNPVTSVTELSPNSAEGTKSVELPAQTSTNNVSVGISKQIFESIHSSFSQEGRNQQITVQLNPPELGKVLIKFQEQDQNITGFLEVSKTQTRIEIEQAIPQIVRDLQDSGIQIKRLDIVLSQQEQSEQEALREQTLQNGWAQQQDSSDSYTGRDNPDADETNEWLINNKSYRNISELQESYNTNDSINMLI